MNRIPAVWRNLRQNHGQALTVTVFLASYFLLGVLLWRFLYWYIQPANSTQKKDLMQALGLIMAGLAGAGGIYFTWRNLRTTQANLRLTEQEQITERFTQAIDQLGATDEEGNKRLEVRLGGIYALERIANDSPERDYSTIMEVLTTYVRENAPWPPRPHKESPASNAKASTELENQEQLKPSADIQAILTVLGRRKKAGKADDVRLDLSATDLRRANLNGAKLQGTFLFGANLQRAVLVLANLEGAVLIDANLERAILIGADLKLANLQGANLQPVRNLTQEQINEAYGDKKTKLPDHLQPPKHWSKDLLEQMKELGDPRVEQMEELGDPRARG
jgi:hypothetical protein